MSTPDNKVLFDEWEVYVAQTKEGPLFISFDVAATREDLSQALPHCARVLIPVQKPNPAGGPVQPESDRLWQMEEELCNLLQSEEVVCRMVARLTHGGVRELVFQVADWESFRPPVGYWMGQQTDYEIDVSEHEGWEFFDECIRPTPEAWRFIADRQVLEQLEKAGSDFDKEHSLEFVFYGEPPRLKEIASRLRQRGYTPLDEATIAEGRLVMVKGMKPSLGEVNQESSANAELAEELGVEFDGWGCAVVP